jgi:DNA-binding transcriptional MocR family regulator
LQSYRVKYHNLAVTIWRPTIGQSSRPIYAQIADRIEQDIGGGVLVAGSRLPTQRELAEALGITTVTVTRAYREAARRGLLASTVGRGTFVSTPGNGTSDTLDEEIDLSSNVIYGGELTLSRELMARIASAFSPTYGAPEGSERHRAAGAAWLHRWRPDATARRVVVHAGAQQAMFAALAALARPGETVLCEEVVYPCLRLMAGLLRLRLEPLPMDRYGLLTDSFEQAAKAKSAKVAYITPTLQNPTGTILPEKRRRELAASAAAHGVTIIEDDVYGFLVPEAPPPVTSLDPDRHVFLTGLGKSISAALRIGYTVSNEELAARMAEVVWTTTFFTSPVMAEVAATWIEDGTAARVAAAKRETIALRQRVARRVLGKRVTGGETSPHLWLELPARRDPEEFAEQARARGVRVAPSSRFALGEGRHNAIRVSIGATESASRLETALQILSALLDRAPRPTDVVMV